MENLLNAKIDYQITRTSFGVWRRYLYSSGQLYSEFTSDARVGQWPLVHIANGRSPETGKLVRARGFIAIGRLAIGVIAIGHASLGVLAVGQAAFGLVALGQLAVSGVFAVGQVAIGAGAIGQFAAGWFSFGQFAAGIWSYGQYYAGQNLLDLLRR